MQRLVRSQRGLTIIELLVVMSIIAVVTGVAIGMIRRGDSALIAESGARVIRANVRATRNTARAAGLGAMLRLDPEEYAVEAWTVDVGGNWHFEDDRGARGTRIDLGGELTDDGVLLRALHLDGARADLGSYPFYSAPGGFRFALWLRPQRLSNASIVARDRVFKLAMSDDGGLTATLHVAPQGESVVIGTRPAVVSPGRWSRVAIAYDRIELRIEVDGVVFAKRREERAVSSRSDVHLYIGGGFTGEVDEARFDVVRPEARDTFSPRLDLLEDSARILRFDEYGRLDRRFHRGAAILRLRADDDPDHVVTIRVEPSGVIR